MSQWSHTPPHKTGEIAWTVTLHENGFITVSCIKEGWTVNVLTVARNAVLDLGNAIRRTEVNRVLVQQNQQTKPATEGEAT